MSKFFEYEEENNEPQWFHIKARDMGIFQPDGKIITFWLWGDSDSHIRQLLNKKNIKDIEWIKKEKPSFA